MIPKLLTFTRTLEQLRSLQEATDYLYFRGLVDGMAIVASADELQGRACHFIHRCLEEFSLEAVQPEQMEWLQAASLRALHEERPQVVLLPCGDEAFTAPLAQRAHELGVLVLQGSGPEGLESQLARLPLAHPEPRAHEGEFTRARLARTLDPLGLMRQLCADGAWEAFEPVNCAVIPEGPRFRYGDYDSETSFQPASHDLRALLKSVGGSWDIRCDGREFHLRWGQKPSPWLERFPLSGRPHRIVVADSQNVAGSVLNHSLAINRYTPWQATALCAQRHPFIDYPQQECRVHFAAEGLTTELRRDLEEAEVFLFFEDDDECSSAWPFDLRPFVAGKPILHLYIGQRVHRNVAHHQRPGRTVITPLPHLIRMFPRAKFYAGFPPETLNEMQLRPPRSANDGIVRILHTPSLPHETTHRYYYHKDTEAFLESARLLKRRYPKVQFWQLGGLDHAKILSARQDCDITFNQLRGFHGLSGDEAMYLERPMVQAFDQNNINRHREYWGMELDFPWISSSPGQLSEALARLIEDPEGRQQLGRRAREFMLEYFSPQKGIIPLIHHCEKALEEKL